MVAQEEQNFFEAVLFSPHPFRRPRTLLPLPFGGGESWSDRLACHIRMLRNADQFFGDVLRRQNEVHTARRNGVARHGIVLGRFVLSKGDSAFGFDGLHPQRPV